MKLTDLLTGIAIGVLDSDISITGICEDSRDIKAGDLFFAFKGTRFEATHFIEEAIAKKASVILCEGIGEHYQKDSTWVVFLPELKQYALTIMLRFLGVDPADLTLYGVTGTNGKTSVAYWLAQALDAGYFGTIGNGHWSQLNETINTTSSPLVTAKVLAALYHKDVKTAVLEVSSHALSQQRVDGLLFHTAIFTNLSHEHLDYHGTMEAYYQAKQTLFLFPGLKYSIINIDCEWGQRLANELKGTEIITFSLKEPKATLTAANYQQTIQGIEASIKTPEGDFELTVPFFCAFNLSNLLAVAGALYVSGHELNSIQKKLMALKPVRGRMERAATKPTVVIDYAHTPDALEKALLNLKELTKGKLWCVFGCGGDRDKAKRPLMGEIAATYADYCIITNDNPRTESPRTIADEIVAGIASGNSTYHIELDRKKAILYAISKASSSDVILIAGKGHEDYQIIGQKTLHFSDHEVVIEATKGLESINN